MAYKAYRLGGGLSLKAAADAIPDDALSASGFCSFDEAGTLKSARGRDKLNSGSVVAGSGSILGHFDGKVTSTKYRFTKRGADVYRDFTTDLGAPAALWPGRTAVDYSATGYLTGFAYGNYVYTADGTALARWNGTTAEAWGLTAPGYQELTGAAPISTATSTTQTITTTYPMPTGMTTGAPVSHNIELVGMEPVGGVVGKDINKLHRTFSAAATGDIAVTGTFTNAQMTFTFKRLLAATSFTRIEVDTSNLTGTVSVAWERTTAGGANPPTNEVQKITITATAGTFRLKHEGEFTSDITYSGATAVSVVQDAMIALPNIGQAQDAESGTVASVTAASTFTITTAAATATTTGGGSIGFMRQGPVCTVSGSADGALEEGRFFYAYTFYNGVAESNFSAQVPVDVQVRNSSVALTKIIPGPAGTTERRIYRTDVNGRPLYYIGKLGDNTTTTFTDYNRLPPGADPYALVGDAVTDEEFEETVLSRLSGRQQAEKRAILDAEASERQKQRTATNLGLQAGWTDHDPPPLGLQEVGILNETCFGIADGEVRFSEVGNPEHWPLGNRLKPGRNVSETAQTWRAFDRDCIIYTDSALYRFSQLGLDFQDARFEEIESPVGLAGKRAVAALDGQAGHLFLAKSGIYLFDGARVTEVSYPIEKMFTDSTHLDYVNPSYMSTAIMVTSRDRMYLSYGSSADNDRLMVVDFQDPQNPKFSVNSWSHTMLFRERVDNTLVAGDSSGYVYQLDNGWTDDDAAIVWTWTSKEFRLNDGMAFQLDEVILDASLAASTTTVTVYVRQRDTSKTVTFTLDDTGRQRIRMKVPTYMRGEVARVALTSSGASERAAYELGFTYMPLGEP